MIKLLTLKELHKYLTGKKKIKKGYQIYFARGNKKSISKILKEK